MKQGRGTDVVAKVKAAPWGTVVHLIWATMERALPRVASAAIMIVFAAFTGPESVGIYTWVILAYTLYQAIAENALRNQAVLGVENPEFVDWVRRSARGAGFAGFALIAGTLALLLWRLADAGRHEVAGLMPFALAPFITTAGVIPTARLQFRQEWDRLARYQLLAALCGLSMALTVVLLTHSSLAMSVHVLVTETVFLTLVRRRSETLPIPPGPGSRHPREGFWSLTALSTLGWTQGQVERVFIGGIAGVGRLGLYSAATTIGRSPGEALSVATANYLRATIASEHEPSRHAAIVRRIGTVSVVAAAGMVWVVLAIVELLLAPALGARWQQAIEVAPLIAVAAIPYAASLSLQVMAVFLGKPRASIVPAILAIGFAPIIGFVAVQSIRSAAVVVIAKELMVLLLCQGLARVPGAARPVVLGTSLTAVTLLALELLT